VAEESGALLAGDICNTNVYESGDSGAYLEARTMFEEQVSWAEEAGVDFIVGETFSYAEETLIGLEVIKEAGLPAVITLAVHHEPETREGWSVAEACKRLEDAGADVVGLNCIRGPRTMMPLLEEVMPVVGVPVAALPVPYRTHEEEPSFQSLREPHYDGLPLERPFPTALDPFTCNRYEIADFTREAWDLGVSYFGLCCGAAPHHIRSMAQALGRKPPASRYSPDMSKHAFLGTDPTLQRQNIEYSSEL
jgi:betaine-homocysteine S-methyltransferase